MTRIIVTSALVIISLVVSYIVTVDLTTAFDNGWKVFLVGLAVALTIGKLVLDIKAEKAPGIKRIGKRNQRARIQKYMTELINESSTSSVFSRDLSWADGSAKAALLAKAHDESLTLVLPKASKLSDELEAAGATVHLYKDIGYVINSRFTIVNADTTSAAVAIGRKHGDVHIIEKISGVEHAGYMLAIDLFNVLRKKP